MTPRYPYSGNSLAQLGTCHEDLQRLFMRVAEHCDTSIIEGHRDEVRQNRLYETGFSKLRWPQSKHNTRPSLAVDASPYPVDWGNIQRFAMFAGLVLGIAAEMQIPIRAGIDWNGNLDPMDNWIDAAHFELREVAT